MQLAKGIHKLLDLAKDLGGLKVGGFGVQHEEESAMVDFLEWNVRIENRGSSDSVK